MDKIIPGDLVFWKDNQIYVISPELVEHESGNLSRFFSVYGMKPYIKDVAGLFCWDTAEGRQSDPDSIYGKWVFNPIRKDVNWYSIPFKDFPNDFKAALLLLK